MDVIIQKTGIDYKGQRRTQVFEYNIFKNNSSLKLNFNKNLTRHSPNNKKKYVWLYLTSSYKHSTDINKTINNQEWYSRLMSYATYSTFTA